MANELTLSPADISVPQTALQRGISAQQWAALKEAVYPGKSDQMVLLALDYCKARGLDPIKKPVHIVKTWDADQCRMVETIWEGINSHRTTAARTSQYAGIDEPVFGPSVTAALGSAQVTFPEWGKVTVYRRIGSGIDVGKCAFTAKLYWRETCSCKKDGTPTQRWVRAPFAQFAKCLEAEALRKAFPEELGGRPTAEEMEGRTINESDDVVDVTPAASRLDAIENTFTDRPGSPPLAEAGSGRAPSGPPLTRDAPAAGRPWDRGVAEKSATHKFPVFENGITRYFATIADWAHAVLDVMGDAMFPDDVARYHGKIATKMRREIPAISGADDVALKAFEAALAAFD